MEPPYYESFPGELLIFNSEGEREIYIENFTHKYELLLDLKYYNGCVYTSSFTFQASILRKIRIIEYTTETSNVEPIGYPAIFAAIIITTLVIVIVLLNVKR